MTDKDNKVKNKIVPLQKESSSEILDIGKGGNPNVKDIAAEVLVKTAESLSGGELSTESANILKTFVNNSTMGFTSVIPMRCQGTSCPFLSACPLYLAGSKLPLGQACPVEKVLVATWVTKHLKALGIEDIADPENSFDMDLLYELAGQELIRWRCGVHLSDDPTLVKREHVNTTLADEQLFQDMINPVIDIMERAGRNIQRIREALVATREAQVKAGQESKDSSMNAAELRAKAMAILEQKKQYLNRIKQPEIIKDAIIVEKDNPPE